MRPFHYAFKVKDIDSTRKFYVDMLGCKEGRSTDSWIDFDFFGHQLSAHISDNISQADYCGKVDGVKVPIPHFGCILGLDKFKGIQEKLDQFDIQYIVKAQLRYPNAPGEQWTMFFLDLSGNPIEFKAFKNEEDIFVP